MAYFLKKNKKNDKVYLSIVNSFYDSEKKQTVHETFSSYGTGQCLIDKGIDNPINYLENEVNHGTSLRGDSTLHVIACKKNRSTIKEIHITFPFVGYDQITSSG